jgi:hypothetical protein
MSLVLTINEINITLREMICGNFAVVKVFNLSKSDSNTVVSIYNFNYSVF